MTQNRNDAVKRTTRRVRYILNILLPTFKTLQEKFLLRPVYGLQARGMVVFLVEAALVAGDGGRMDHGKRGRLGGASGFKG